MCCNHCPEVAHLSRLRDMVLRPDDPLCVTAAQDMMAMSFMNFMSCYFECLLLFFFPCDRFVFILKGR